MSLTVVEGQINRALPLQAAVRRSPPDKMVSVFYPLPSKAWRDRTFLSGESLGDSFGCFHSLESDSVFHRHCITGGVEHSAWTLYINML